MSTNEAVIIKHVRKTFNLPTESTTSLKRKLTNYFRGIRGYKCQEVLKDISFEVKKGDFFGVIGRNGSGKSTLLRIISQIYVPDSGTVTVNGRLVSFIELGVGFNPELTGRENVYLNGAMLGFSVNEINSMYDEIVDFSELRPFMNQKLKNYSSGMQIRLAFAVAIQAKSDILVLDEILAVGDEAFQRKCNEYFLNIKKEGKTVILVTHAMDSVRKYCNRAVLIEDGLVKICGSPEEVANQYSLDNMKVQQVISQKKELNSNLSNSIITGTLDNHKKSTVKKVITDFNVILLSKEIMTADNREVFFEISYTVNDDVDTYIAFTMYDTKRNVCVYRDNSFDFPEKGKGIKKNKYKCKLDALNQCTLELTISIHNMDSEPLFIAKRNERPIIVIAAEECLTKGERDSSKGIIKSNGLWLSSK